jgi:PAS domain S-box-containing protein
LRLSSTLAHNIGFLLALALVGLLAWQGQRTASAVLGNNDEVRHSLELISAVKEARSAMQDVETGGRGFVLTGEDDFLAPYTSGRLHWEYALANLRLSLADRQPARTHWLAELERAGAARLRITAASIAYRRTHDLVDAAAYNASLGGKRTMDRLRALLGELEAEERTRLQASQVAIQRRYDDARRILALGATVVALLMFGSLLAINLNLRTRRRLQARAQEQRAFLRNVVDADQSLVYVRGQDGRFDLCNKAFAGLFGLEPGQLEGRTPEAAGIASPAASLLEGDRDIARRRRTEFQDEVLVQSSDGAERWFQRMKLPLLLPDSVPKALTVAIDISSRRQMERMKAEFVSTVSHELRTPLTAIRGSLAMLESGMAGEFDPAAKPLLGIAYNSCERLVRLINDILDIEKLESGRLQLHRQPVQVRAAIEQSLAQNASYARQHDVGFEFAIVGDPWVQADPDRFAQVMANLLSNAAKHSPAGGLVQVDARRDGSMVIIGVRDHGAGVPATFRPRVFERFAQADASDARQRGGTGLGLAITRSLVEQHGGSVGFEDAPGGGTRFHFALPATLAGSGPGPAPEQSDDTAVLLLVDDDADSVRELQAILLATGYRCIPAATGAAALDLLAREPVRAVLVNLGLASEDPLAFIRELRAVPDYRHMPVLGLGTQPATGDATGVAIGIGDWLRKPFDADRVVDAVRACVEPGERSQVLHVEDDEDLRAMVAGLLAGESLVLHGAGSLAEARAALGARHHALVVLDLMLPDGDGSELLAELASARPPTRVIIFSARDSALPESAVILRRLVKSQHGGPELAALVHAHLRHWPQSSPPGGES